MTSPLACARRSCEGCKGPGHYDKAFGRLFRISYAILDLDAQLAKLVDGEAHAVGYPVPGNAAEEEADAFPEIPGSMPVPDGIVVKNEVMGGRAKRPVAKAAYLKDLAAVAGRIVRTLLVRKPPAIAAKDGDFTPEKLRIQKRLVAFGHEALYGRGIAGHALAGQFVAAGEVDGDFVDETSEPERPGSGHGCLLSLDLGDGALWRIMSPRRIEKAERQDSIIQRDGDD